VLPRSALGSLHEGPRVRARDRAGRLFALCSLCFVACGSGAADRGRERAVISVQPAPVKTIAAPTLTHPAAFELVATSEGALLAWAAGSCRAGVHAQRFDANGAPQLGAASISACDPSGPDVDAAISELSAVASAGKLALAWITGNSVLGTYATDHAADFAPTLQLGAAEPGAGTERGRLLLSASETGQQRVHWRAPRGPCAGEAGGCAMLVTQPHPPAAEAAARTIDTREIPFPCPRLLVGSAWSQGVWYDAFCALDAQAGRATTQVYAIRPEIFYAEVVPVLSDCAPLGAAPSQSGIVVFGQCGSTLRAHVLREGRRQAISVSDRQVRCEAGRPVLELHSDGAATETLRLDAPRDRLELWLPPSVAPSGSRAAFTGRRLLIATLQANRLTLRSQHCEGQTLVSDSPTML
jgi:hypothetical protein